MFKVYLIISVASFCKVVLSANPFPVVDLGYARHQALTYDNWSDTYAFNNIRYAQPPVGKFRFAPPVPPNGRNPVMQNGIEPVTCPQAVPTWFSMGTVFGSSFAAGNYTSFNYTEAKPTAAAVNAQQVGQILSQPGISEDCLFLDVYAPATAVNAAKKPHAKRSTSGAPVVLWIHGGGYIEGSKTAAGSPYGLIKASQKSGKPIIFVQINYRLGAFGWLAGPTLQGAGGVSNAGLHDQRLALEWVQQHITLFGGDPSRVTVMGESAGGGSVLHQLTAYGGQEPFPFKQAISQSAAWWPLLPSTQENTTQQFLDHLNVSTIEAARQASSDALMQANRAVVAAVPEGMLNLGPVVDGDFVPSHFGSSLLSGAYAKNITVMSGHNTNEAPLFVSPPYSGTDEDIKSWFMSNYPSASAATLDYITDTLYPAIYDGSQPYTTPIDRLILMTSDCLFTCNINYVNTAYGNRTYNYEYEVPPALHAEDLSYTFYNSQAPTPNGPVSPQLAESMQQYFANFIAHGNPNGNGLPTFPIQGESTTQMGFNVTKDFSPDIVAEQDSTANSKCEWWQKYLYL